MTSNPTVIFVPSAWHTPTVFYAVTTRLSSHNYTSHLVVFPSVGASPGLPNFDADVTALQTSSASSLQPAKT